MSVIEERRNAYLKLTVFLLFGVWWGTVVKAQVEDYTFTTNTDNTICIVMYRGFGGDVVVPDYINGMPVTSIGDHAFEGYWPMTSVVLPSNLTRIGINAFAQCSTLTTITIPGSVTWMGFQAFASCYGLTNITMGTNIVSMESAIFGFCYGLTRVKISDGVTMIGSKTSCPC